MCLFQRLPCSPWPAVPDSRSHGPGHGAFCKHSRSDLTCLVSDFPSCLDPDLHRSQVYQLCLVLGENGRSQRVSHQTKTSSSFPASVVRDLENAAPNTAGGDPFSTSSSDLTRTEGAKQGAGEE